MYSTGTVIGSFLLKYTDIIIIIDGLQDHYYCISTKLPYKYQPNCPA